MRIGIIGPNFAPQLNSEELQVRKNNLSRFASIVAESGLEIVLTPDTTSLLEHFGKEYLSVGGKKIYEVVPLDDDYEEHLNTDLGEIISCGMWPSQPSKMNEETDVLFCVGYGGMVLAEIGFSRYYNPKTVYILKEFISTELPKEIGLDLKYITTNEAESILESLEKTQ